MARVTVEDCVDKVPNRFDLVLLAAQRAREISGGAELTLDRDRDKTRSLPCVKSPSRRSGRKISKNRLLPDCRKSCPTTKTMPTKSVRSASRQKRCASPRARRPARPRSAPITTADPDRSLRGKLSRSEKGRLTGGLFRLPAPDLSEHDANLTVAACSCLDGERMHTCCVSRGGHTRETR